MKSTAKALLCGLILSAPVLVIVGNAGAVLGGSADTVDSDSVALSAVRASAATRNNYTVHEFESGGTMVREYVSPSGVVFGIAWNGLTHPDLDVLLGSYAGAYRSALQQTPRKPGRRRIQVKTGSVVVQKWGHMRNLQGRAYDPALIPEGVNIDEIR